VFLRLPRRFNAISLLVVLVALSLLLLLLITQTASLSIDGSFKFALLSLVLGGRQLQDSLQNLLFVHS
jgi:hypothetical protein